MYGLDGVHVTATETWREGTRIGQVVGAVLERAGLAPDPLGDDVLTSGPPYTAPSR